MKKKALAILLTAAMALGLAACGGGSAQTGQSSAPPAQDTQQSADNTGSTDGAAAENTRFDELKHLVVAFPTFTGAPVDTEMVVAEVNKILVEKYNIEVEFQISDAGSYQQNLTLALSGGEQLDVVCTLFGSYPNLVNQGYFLDLEADGLLQTYGAGISGVISQEYLDACRIGGVLYGITNTRDYAVGRGCIAVGTEYLDAIGYQAPADAGEIIKITEEELNDIFAKLHTQFPNLEVYRPASNDLMQQTLLDQIGGNNFGVLLGDSDELKIVNLFETDMYMNFCKRVYDWNQKGYISKDAAADTTAVLVLMKDGVIMAYGTGGKPGSKAQESRGGRDVTIFQTKSDYIASSSVSGFPWVIPINTVDAKAAMILLNELYTNPELADLVCYGVEGVHYTITADGLLDTSGGTSSGNYSTLNWAYPNQFASTVTVGNAPDLWEQTTTFNNSAAKSPALGFSFDSSPVATEVTAVTNVYNEYSTSLEYGFLDPEQEIPKMIERLNAAGLQKIIDEKQKQLDAWATSK